MKKALLTASIALSSTALAFAQLTPTTSQQGTVNATALLQLLAVAQTILSRLIPFAITLAVVVFFFFLIKFIWKGSSDPKERDESLKGMGWSVVALFVMVSIWGIVEFLGSIVGVGQGGTIPVPTEPY